MVSEYDRILKAETDLLNYRMGLIKLARERATDLPPVFMLGLKHNTLESLIKSGEPATVLLSESFWRDLKSESISYTHIHEPSTVLVEGMITSAFLGGVLGVRAPYIPVLTDCPLFQSQRFLGPDEAFILLDHTTYNLDDLLVMMSKAEPLKLARVVRAMAS